MLLNICPWFVMVSNLSLRQAHGVEQVAHGCAQNVVAHEIVVVPLSTYFHRDFIFSVAEEDVILVKIPIYRIAGISMNTDFIIVEHIMVDPIVKPFLLTIDVHGHGTVVRQHVIPYNAPL